MEHKDISSTIEDWNLWLGHFLEFNEHEILNHNGTVAAEIAKSFAESEWS